MHEDGEGHLHRIGLFIRQRLDGDRGEPLFHRVDFPIDALLAVGGNLDHLHGRGIGRQEARRESDLGLHLLGRCEVVVDVGAENDLVTLHKEPRRLQAYQEILACYRGGGRRADLGRLADSPGVDLPGGQRFGELDRHGGLAFRARRDRRRPERGIGEVRADRSFHKHLSSTSA